MEVCLVSPWLYLYFTPQSDDIAGGAQRQQYLISQELVARGHNVSAIVGDFGQNQVEHRDGVELIKGAPRDVNGPISTIKHVYSLWKSMKYAGADIYLVRGTPRLTIVTHLLTRTLGARFVFRLANDSDVDHGYLRSRYPNPVVKLYNTTIDRADCVVTQTTSQQSKLKSRGIEAMQVPNGYDMPPDSDIVDHQRRTDIVWVGSSDPDQKCPGRFIGLAKRLPNLKFTMISKPLSDQKSAHEQLRTTARSVDNLDFLGAVSPDDVHKYYQRAAMLINTSDYEGFPNTYLEAWRYATPVISLTFDVDKLLSRGIGGVRVGSMDSLVETVDRLYRTPAVRSRLGSSGRSQLEHKYSLERVTDEYENIFTSIT